MARDTLLDFFHDLARASGPFLAHDDGYRDRQFSYADIGRSARQFAARLHAAGLGKGDPVIFFSENRPEWIVAFWGCLLRGVVVVPIDYRSPTEFLARVARIVKARVVLVGQEVPAVDGGAHQIDARIWRMSSIDCVAAAPAADAALPPVAIGSGDVAEIIFTSGATAEPKGVVITHRNVLANIVPVEREVVKYRKWGTPFFPIRFLNLLPLSHMFGQAMATFVPPMLPGVVVFMRGYNPAEIVAQIKKRRISVLVSVPKILDVLREHILRLEPSAGTPGPKQHFVKRWWRYRGVHRRFGFKFWSFVVGAAPLDPSLEAFWGELGFAVIQGYGLTETAPIVTLNHPFGTRRGSVGKAIAGVEVKIAEDGEILVRGENVTRGYFNAEAETAKAFADGWFHTGDIGEVGPDGQLFIKGRKKEMIVTPEGLNVFPEDVERVVVQVPGVKDCAVIGLTGSRGEERVAAVLVVESGTDPDGVVREANARLADHQQIRRALNWPEPELPRTEGTRKLKRAAIREWAIATVSGQPVAAPSPAADPLAALVARYAGRSDLAPGTTLQELGLSSLERVELLVALEDKFGTRIDEGAFAGAENLEALRALVEGPGTPGSEITEPVDFPAWNRSRPARAIRRVSLPSWLLPLARVFAHLEVVGVDHLRSIASPVVYAANHQSHMDAPVILAALPPRLRYRVAIAMAKEFFRPHFFPAEFGRRAWFTNSVNYYLASLFFNAFPLPQREAGARQTLRYIGEVLQQGDSVLIFPEGRRNPTGDVDRFRPGIGMIAARLGVPVVPVRIHGLDKVLPPGWSMAKPGPVRVAFGPPLTLEGDDYEKLARQVEDAVRAL